VLLLALRGVAAAGEKFSWDLRTILAANVAIWFGYLVVLVALLVILYRRNETGFRSQDIARARPAAVTKGLVIATYVASTAWIVGLAWIMGDGVVAVAVLLLTMMLATWNLRRMRCLSEADAHRLHARCHSTLCAGLLVVVNLRVDHWVAPLYRVSVEEMRGLLPMTAIHLLTAGLLCWALALLRVTDRNFRRRGALEKKPKAGL
jgi:hypothetical protein